MAAGSNTNVRRWHITVFSAVLPFLIVGGFVVRCAGSAPIPTTILPYLVGFSQPKLIYLRPGLRIAKKAPKGWTHLVMKSIPRLVSGDRDSLPAGSAKTAALFHSVLVANVKPVDMNEKEFELTQVGLGICVPNPQDESQDVVVRAESLDALGLHHLTMVQRMVLDAAENEMAEGRIIARTATFALFRSPVSMVETSGKHGKFNLYYALCADRTTGKLHVGVWPMRMNTDLQQAPTTMVKLASNSVFSCDLDVHAKRILGTVPYSWSFAMKALPPGKNLRVPPALGRAILETSRHPAESDPDELERLFMETLSPLPDPNIANERTAVPTLDRAIRRTAIPPPYAQVQ